MKEKDFNPDLNLEEPLKPSIPITYIPQKQQPNELRGKGIDESSLVIINYDNQIENFVNDISEDEDSFLNSD